MARTHFPMNYNSRFVFGIKKTNTHCTWQGLTTHNGSSIFNTVFCKFLWSDCHLIFTVLPEIQKLYLTEISHWSVHKMLRKKIGKLTFETTPIYATLIRWRRGEDSIFEVRMIFRIIFWLSHPLFHFHFYSNEYHKITHDSWIYIFTGRMFPAFGGSCESCHRFWYAISSRFRAILFADKMALFGENWRSDLLLNYFAEVLIFFKSYIL